MSEHDPKTCPACQNFERDYAAQVKSELAPAGGSGWSKTPPIKPGHYWVALLIGESKKMTVLEVERWHGTMQCFYYQAWRSLDDETYWHNVEWWPSPITKPEVFP